MDSYFNGASDRFRGEQKISTPIAHTLREKWQEKSIGEKLLTAFALPAILAHDAAKWGVNQLPAHKADSDLPSQEL